MIWFWLLVWLFMAMAFTTAWTFIVKGCEAMDVRNPPPTPDPPHHE